MGQVQVFVSYDVEHDRDLYDEFVVQSRSSTYDICVMGASLQGGSEAGSTDAARLSIRDADQVIFLCGAHTGDSTRMGAELRVVQEERTPYILLWGRREIMCTKPVGAKPSEGMYSWTREILRDQIVATDRRARADAATRSSKPETRSLKVQLAMPEPSPEP